MRRFWDARAREDAFYFVDNRLEYGSPDAERFWANGEHDLDQLLALGGVSLHGGEVVVEIGCGVGRLTRSLASRARGVVALDVSEEMLNRARELNPGLDSVRWVHGDGTSLAGIADASADACVSHVVFQHLPDPLITLGYIREMGRVLRPGGWSVFQVSTAPDVHRPGGAGIGSRLRAVAGRAPRGQDDPAWVGSAVQLDDVTKAAGEGRLSVERTFGAGTQYCVLSLRRQRD
jgi:SAM-dependent methyltransferase